jgi:hypothetical protein
VLSVEQLIQESRDPRLQKLPLYARQLIFDLARRMELEKISADAIRDRAGKEVDEVRKIAAEGPEDSDTFMDLPHSQVAGYLEEAEQRPLGKGVNIEFRPEGAEVGEGFDVKLKDGRLHVSGVNHLAVIPGGPMSIVIETR